VGTTSRANQPRRVDEIRPSTLGRRTSPSLWSSLPTPLEHRGGPKHFYLLARSKKLRQQASPISRSSPKWTGGMTDPTIFLSHNHADKPFAARLAGDLRVRGVTPWIDNAEIRPGESLLWKINQAISEIDFVGAILSPDSVSSGWVQTELEMAMTRQVRGEIRVVPLVYRDCELPLFLQGKLWIDFRKPSTYWRRLNELVDGLRQDNRAIALTGKEAARRVKSSFHPRGILCGLSQQGISHQIIPSSFFGINRTWESSDWVRADASTGRSRYWIIDCYDEASRQYTPYGVFDGELVTLPSMTVQGDTPRVFDFNFIDSDHAVALAIDSVISKGLIPNADDDFFILTRCRFYTSTGFIWMVVFMDEALVKCTAVCWVDARSGDTLKASRP
jgi:hypothetical protein